MARVDEARLRGWGQLHAAFQVLEGLADGRSELGTSRRLRKTTDTPRNHFVNLLREAGLQLLAAREKGGAHADAALVVAGDIARLIGPEPMYAKGLDPVQVPLFHQGYEQQIAQYRDRWGDLVG